MSEVSSMSLTERVYDHLCFFDVFLAVLGLFVFCCFRVKLTKKPGPTRGVWLGGSYGAVTSVPANVEYMLKTNFKNFPKGSFYKDRFSDLLEDGIFNADAESWKEQRRIIITEMHSTRFVEHSFQTTQNLVRKKLLKVMEIFTRSQEAFDLQDVLLRLTFDNICIAGLGDDPGTLDSDLPIVPFAQAFEEATESTLFRFMIPPFIWKPMRFFDIGYEKGLRKAVKVIHDFVDKIVVDRIWFFWVIQKHPEVENKIIHEVREILRQRGDSVTSNNESLFTVRELNDMVYLQAALSETLRLYPPIPMEMKQAIEDDVYPADEDSSCFSLVEVLHQGQARSCRCPQSYDNLVHEARSQGDHLAKVAGREDTPSELENQGSQMTEKHYKYNRYICYTISWSS